VKAACVREVTQSEGQDEDVKIFLYPQGETAETSVLKF